jgi:modulator of FtsH protease
MEFQNRSESYAVPVENTSFHKLLKMFSLSILISFIGTAVGSNFAEWGLSGLFLPLIVVQIIMLVSAFFFRKKSRPVGYFFVYFFTFLSGIVIFPAINHYINIGGTGIVTAAFGITTAMFAVLTAYAYFSKRDFSFLGGFLLVGVIALIGLSIVRIFVPSLGVGMLGLSIAFLGIMIFSGFILYDISKFKHGLTDEMIPLAVLCLYLDFINLFLYVLQFLGILSNDD